jgi:hypothetical protein
MRAARLVRLHMAAIRCQVLGECKSTWVRACRASALLAELHRAAAA